MIESVDQDRQYTRSSMILGSPPHGRLFMSDNGGVRYEGR
jgi:hypothetical protein